MKLFGETEKVVSDLEAVGLHTNPLEGCQLVF